MLGRSALELLDELILEIEESIKTPNFDVVVTSSPPTQSATSSHPQEMPNSDLPPPIPESSLPSSGNAPSKADDISIDALELRVGLIAQVCISINRSPLFHSSRFKNTRPPRSSTASSSMSGRRNLDPSLLDSYSITLLKSSLEEKSWWCATLLLGN